MSITYTPSTNFSAKDSLPANDSNKVIRGSEFSTEFVAIQTAFGLAAPAASPTFTGTVTIASVDINGGNIDGTVIGAATPAAGSFTTGQFDTSLNVDGTVTADGLTVDGDVSLTASGTERFSINREVSPDIQYKIATNNYHLALEAVGASQGDIKFATGTSSASDRMLIASNGDLSLYEDTGTTAKFYWDASAEALGIGTSSPSAKLEIRNDVLAATDLDPTAIKLYNNSDGGSAIEFSNAVAGKSKISFGVEGTAASTDDTYLGFSTCVNAGTLTERMRIDSSGNVGINDSSPSEISANATTLTIKGKVNTKSGAIILETADESVRMFMYATDTGAQIGTLTNDPLKFTINSGEAARIDSSGNLLVGTTDTTIFNDNADEYGFMVEPSGQMQLSANNATMLYLNRQNGDGTIIDFRKDGTAVGSIGTVGGRLTAGSGDTGLAFEDTNNRIIPHNISTNAFRDAAIDLGYSSGRFKDLYRSGSTISTSDRNMKQDERPLTDAEAAVAQACKGLLKAFRFIDAVEADGDGARIHFGIIAQDLQAAFEAEGLDANNYAMFRPSTITDDEGNEQTRLGVCYENLLAFIIAAL